MVGDRYLSLAAWELVAKPKEMGGLGIKNMYIFNYALVTKTMWRWVRVHRPEWMQIIQLSQLVLRPWEMESTTALWQNMKAIANFFNVSVSYNLGKGTHVQFWNDRWLRGSLKERYQMVYDQSMAKSKSVQQVNNEGNWNLELGEYVSEEVQAEEQKLRAELQPYNTLQNECEDEVRWRWSDEGNFSVKSFYKVMMGGPYVKLEIYKLWEIKAPPRVQVFAWLMLQDKILTIQNLRKRRWEMPNRCSLCYAQEETVAHLFYQCQYTLAVKNCITTLAPALGVTLTRQRYRKVLLRGVDMQQRGMQLVMCFVIWRERCARIFREENKMPMILAREILQEYRSYFEVH